MLLLALSALAHTGYLRTPDLHGEDIVFVAEGDLWLVSAAGGSARHLTSVVGDEWMPRFSPDGKWIAFNGNYDGNTEVYVIPAAGGEPRRLTWHPGADGVVGWSADGKEVIFRASHEAPTRASYLFAVPVAGGDPRQLPLGWAAWLDIEPGSGRYAFTRTSRESATWKRYRGGTAADIWVGDPARADYRQVTDFTGADAFPMWHGGRVYFLSDQGGTANLWSIAADGSDRKAHSAHREWDARFPAMGPDGRIVYMLAGDLRIFDPKSGEDRAVAVDLPGERVVTRARYAYGPDNLQTFDLSPDGERVLLTVRGELWSLPVKPGPALPLSQSSGARESWGAFSHDGKRVFYLSDRSGEEALESADAWGRGELRTVKPAGASGWHFPPVLSPDGSQVAWSDQTQTLWAAPAAGGAPIKVDHSDQAEIREYVWSPDGRWLAYVRTERTDYSGVWIWDRSTMKSTRVSSPFVHEHSPAWDPDGRYLWLVTERDTNPIMGRKDMTYVSAEMGRPAAVLLRKDVEDPTAALAGLPKPGEEAKKDKKKKDAEEEEEKEPVRIDLDGLADRVVVLPVPATEIWGVGATAGRVLYARARLVGMSRWEDGKSELWAWDLEKRKEELVFGGLDSWVLAPGAGKAAVRRDGAIHVIDVGAPVDEATLGESRIRTEDIAISVNPAEEWRQIYLEAWRHMRDFYWEPAMAGVDWKKERDRYAALLPRLATRQDLEDLIGEVIGELATSHTYVGGGDPGVAARHTAMGVVGAETVREGAAFRITKIYRGDPADNAQNPLLAPAAGIAEGDYILAVNHRPFAADRPFTAAWIETAGKPVVVSVNRRPSPEGAREVVVVPLADDKALRYHDWVRRNREYVAQKTGGEVGYLHVPDMGVGGLTEFDTWFYPQLDKAALVVDVRWNGGGFVSQMLVERLQREVLQYFFARGGGRWTWPDRTLNGPFVVLTNEFAGSDGDIFPTAIQNAGLAPVIGMRSWGGVIGIRGDKPMVDGGFTSQPEYASWYPKTGWTVENHGVDPDIVVQNLPQELARGVDSQLDRAIAEVQALRKSQPPVPSQPGPPPTKTREDFRKQEGN